MHSEHRSVRELAYQLWKARGCPDGTAEQDWQEAERQLAAPKTQAASKTQAAKSAAVDASLKDSFPASDPPATQGPDEPPANAAAKWKAAGVSRKKLNRRSTPASSK
jgi:Protein of unknown function (DUF2934)